MTVKLQQVPSPASEEAGDRDHERLSLAQFAARIGITRQTAYKWAKYYRHKFPPGSLLRDPQGHFGVDWDVYKKGFTVLN